MSVRDEVEKLASKIAQEATAEGVQLIDRVDALKVLSGYLTATMKGNKDAQMDERPTMSALTRRLEIARSSAKGSKVVPLREEDDDE